MKETIILLVPLRGLFRLKLNISAYGTNGELKYDNTGQKKAFQRA